MAPVINLVAGALTFLSLIEVGFASPVVKYKTETLTAKYDNLTVLPGLDQLNGIGLYMGLSYLNFNVTSPGVDGVIVTGVAPKSPKNYASPGGVSTVTAVYPGSKVSYFDLQSFYYGCNIAAQEVAAQVPAPCIFQVDGYKSGKKQASTKLIFQPQDIVTHPVAQMTYGKLPSSFNGIDTFVVNVTLVQVAGMELAAGHIDNLLYTTYNATK